MSRDDLLVCGDKNVKVPAHLNFGKFILDRIRRKNDEIALEYWNTKKEITYREFTQYAVNMSIALTKLGVGRGDIVAVASEKRNEFLPTLLAIVFTGAAYTSYPLKKGEEFVAILKHELSLTKPKYFITSNRFWELFKEVLLKFDFIKKFITLDDEVESITSVNTLFGDDVDIHKFEPVQVQGQIDTACVLYSSGTTGMPKAIQLTHLNCILGSLPDNFSDESLQTSFLLGLWYHNYDMFMTYKFLAMGRKIVYVEEKVPDNFLKFIDSCKINIAFISPSVIGSMLKAEEADTYELDSLKIIYSRSAPLHYKTIQEVERRFPKLKFVFQGYGMTEAGELSSESWGINGPKPGSVGVASPGVILKIVDLKTRKTLGPNQQGEIYLRGPTFMKGYIDVDPSTYLNEEGFYKSGDVGYYDEDKYIYIVERLKEIITYDGYNIAPLELETILQLHPSVREAGVVGKPVVDHGMAPTAFVVKQPGINVTQQELLDYVATEVPPYMQLRGGVTFIDEMPKNLRGKILKHRLREMLK